MAEQDKAEASKSSEEAKTKKASEQKSSEQSQNANAQETQPYAATDLDAIALLKSDHRAVEALFARYESASRRTEKITIAQQVSQDLIIHTIIEEEIFYPACREHVDDKKLDEAQVEHDSAKTLINELLSGSPENDGYFDAKVKVLADLIKHHVEEEEKRAEGIFAKAKAAGLDVEDLGRQLAARKTQLKQQAERQGLGRPHPRTFRALSQSSKEDYMAQSSYRERNGRYDDDDDRRGRSRTPDRDDQGRFISDDDDRGSSRSSSSLRGSRSRDDEDDYRGGSRSSARSSSGRSRDDDDDDRGGGSRSRGSSSRSRDEDDDDRRYSQASRNRGGRSQGGWFGDSEGHSEAARRGWENPDHGDSGWYGDSRGHSEASRRGWQNSDHEGSGWYGDSEGHSEASRRGWENREGSRGRSRYDDEDRGSSRSQGSRQSYSRSREDDDDDRRGGGRSGGGRSGGGRGSDRGQGGWFGDSEGHSEASRRGWENRR